MRRGTPERARGFLWAWIALGLFAYVEPAGAQFRARGRPRPNAEARPRVPPPKTPKATTDEAPGKAGESLCDDLVSRADLAESVRRCEESRSGVDDTGGRVALELAKAFDVLGRDDEFRRAFRRALSESRGRGLHREVLRFGLDRAARTGDLEDFVRRHEGDFRSQEEKLLLVEAELSRGATERAVALLEKESRGSGATRDVVLRFAKLAIEQGRANDALPLLLRLLGRDVLDEEVWGFALRAAEETGRRAVLVDRLTSALRAARDYDELERMRDLAERFADEKVLATFEERLQAVSKQDPRGYLARLARGLDGQRAFDLDASLLEAERFASRENEFASALGNLLLDHERISVGLEWLRRGARATPSGRRALALGLERAASLDEKRARTYRAEAASTWKEIAFDRSRGLPSARAEARRRLLSLRAKERRLPEELSALEARRRGSEAVVEDLLFEAELREALFEFTRAEEVLALAREKFPADPLPLGASVEFYERRKRPEQVARFLRDWVAREPNRAGLLRARLVGALEAAGQRDAALAEIEAGLAEAPDELPLLSRFAKIASGTGERARLSRAIVAAMDRRGDEPELVLLLLGMPLETTTDRLEAAFVRAVGRARRPEQVTPLLVAADASGRVRGDVVARETLAAFARFSTDRELELFAFGYFGRLERSAISAATNDRLDYLLLSELARRDGGHARPEVLSLLEANPPRAHSHLLLGFLRSPPDRQLVPRVFALLRRQDSLRPKDAEALVLETESIGVRRGILLELVRRGEGLSAKLLDAVSHSEDPASVAYAVLSLGPRRADAFARKLPGAVAQDPAVEAAVALVGTEPPAASRDSGSPLGRAVIAYRAAMRALAGPGGDLSDSELSRVFSSNRLERGAVQHAIVGTTPQEFQSLVVELSAPDPSRPELGFERALARAEGWRRSMWSRSFFATLTLVRRGLEADEATIRQALELLAALEDAGLGGDGGPVELERLLPALERVLGRGDELAVAAIQQFRLFRGVGAGAGLDARASFIRRALAIGGAPALAMRAELEEAGIERTADFLLENFEAQARWVERSRDLRSLARIALRREHAASRAARAHLERIARGDDTVARAEAAALLSMVAAP